MSKSKVSPGFAKFAAKTTTGKFDEARKAERMGAGVPFDIGQKGTGIITVYMDEFEDKNTKIRSPQIRGEIEVETPEGARGKILARCNGLGQIIKDGPNPEKWTKEMAFTSALGMLERWGCPEEITQGYNEIQEITDWFDAEPRRVSWTITDASYEKAGRTVAQKGVEAYALVPEEAIRSADEGGDEDPEAETCMYNGTRHEIRADHGDTLDLYSPKSDRLRKRVPRANVTFK